MQTEPEQWARDLLEAVHDASDMGSACGMVDCPQCKAAALIIQRAFEERERKLREAVETLEAALIRDMGAGYAGVALCQALKETPDAQ